MTNTPPATGSLAPGSLAVVVLAAGAGTRMRSDLPKPLYEVGRAPLLAHVLRAAGALSPERIVIVVGHGGARVATAVERLAPEIGVEARVVEQAERRGTGHAVLQALPALDGFEGRALVLYADTPLIRAETLRRLVASPAAVAVLGFETGEPGGYGRLIRGEDGGLDRIVEAADATEAERGVELCNSGVMVFDAADGRRWLPGLSSENAKGELYLTDLVSLARAEGRPCAAVTGDAEEALGVNDRAQLAAVEAAFQARARAAAMAGGATLVAPETVFLAWDTRLGRDVTVGPNVVFGPGVVVEDGVRIEAFSWLEGARVRRGAVVGPFARLRPGAEVGEGAHVGNFVEIKNAVLGPGAKANHLAYVGDASVGARANLGAGTITCNYDGVSKHRTEIGAEAFIGSNAALVAPVRVGDRATVGAGSTIVEDVPDDALAVARGRQETKPGLAARLRARLAAAKGRG